MDEILPGASHEAKAKASRERIQRWLASQRNAAWAEGALCAAHISSTALSSSIAFLVSSLVHKYVIHVLCLERREVWDVSSKVRE